ncbi:MAG: mechanosensitive ion channel domain-containing protein [Planctomycetota bacterium]
MSFWSATLAQNDTTPPENPAPDADPTAAAGAAPDGAAPTLEGAGDQASKAAGALKDGDLGGAADAGYDLFVTYGIPAISALVILIAAYFVGKFLGRVASTPVRKRIDETIGKFIGKLVFYAVMVFALMGVLGKFGVSVASFAAVLAAAGFAIGLAFQGSLSNFAAGVMLLAFRPFKVGDVCVLNGVLGKVDAIDLFVTHINTLDNRKIVMPNSQIADSTIEVITHHPERRIEVLVGTAYDADLDQTRAVLDAAVGRIEGIVQGEGRGHMIVLDELGGSSINWKVWAWAPAADFLALKQQITRDIKVALDDAGISIPYPQMDVHLDGAVSR